jgi:putative transposase
MSFLADKWESDDTIVPQEMYKAHKVRIYPNKDQIKLWTQWMHTYRYVYNKALHHVIDNKGTSNKQELRNLLVTSVSGRDKIKNTNVQAWELDTPKTIRQQAVFEFAQAYKTNWKMFYQGKKPFFQMKTKKRVHNEPMTIRFDDTNCWKLEEHGIKFFSQSSHFPYISIGASMMGKLKRLYTRDNLCKSGALMYDKGKWFFIFTEKHEPKVRKTRPSNVIALDGGARSFMTGYNEHEILTILQPRHELFKLRQKTNVLQAKKLSPKIRKALKKCRERIKNLVNEVHWKTIKYLLTKYDVLIFGDIKTQSILQSKILSKDTKREMQDLSFYTFKSRLINKAKEFNKVVILTCEAYTSKTCTYCGTIHEVGSKKTFKCPQCKEEYDRDEGAARNIFMKTMLDQKRTKTMSLV